VPLRELLENEQSKNSIPKIIQLCVEHITKSRTLLLFSTLTNLVISIEGIFRISASPTQINALVETIDKGGQVDFKLISDPHVVPGLMKKFFRDLPDPLLTNELYTCFIAIWGAFDNPTGDHIKIVLQIHVNFVADDECRLLQRSVIQSPYFTIQSLTSFRSQS
jgi:hypothetical protein